jgi:hypothetical protein
MAACWEAQPLALSEHVLIEPRRQIVHDELGTPRRWHADIGALEGLAVVRRLLLCNSLATRGSSSRRPPVVSNTPALTHKVFEILLRLR